MRKSRTHFGPKVEAAFEVLVDLDFGPKAIAQALKDRFGAEHAPKERTIKDWLAKRLRAELGPPWQIEDLDPDDAAVVLSAFAAVTRESSGHRIRPFSLALADWIARLHRICADIEPFWLHSLANLYLRRRANDEPTDDVDAYLAFAPWRSPDAWNAYAECVAIEAVSKPPPIAAWHLATQLQPLTDDDLATLRAEIEADSERGRQRVLERERSNPND